MAYRVLRTRRGYDAREVVSAFQKEVRRSDPDAALYWGVELHKSGYRDWLWKRIRVIATEDCHPLAGINAEIEALYAKAQDFKAKARKDFDPTLDRIWAVQAILVIACAPKNRMADLVLYTHGSDNMPRREIPDYALDEHTARGKRMKRSTEHFHKEAAKLIDPDFAAAERGHLDMNEELAALENRYRTMRLMQVDPRASQDLPQNPWGRLPADDAKEEADDDGVNTLNLSGPKGQGKLV